MPPISSTLVIQFDIIRGMKDLKEAYKTIEARGFHPLTPKSAAPIW